MNEKKPFTENHIIYSDALNSDITASYLQLMRIALETGSRHSASVGYGLDYYIGAQKGWVIMRWDVEFLAYPKWNETVVASTWPTLFKGFVGERAYTVTYPNGEPIMAAHSAWILFDLNKRSAVRPDKEHIERYLPTYPPALEADFGMADVNGREAVSVRAYTVRRTDIDSNGHVNNLRYIMWAFDSTGVEFVKRLKVSYKKECTLGERVIVEVFEVEGVRAVRIKNEVGVALAEIDVWL